MTEEVIEITSSSEAEDETRKGQKQNLGDELDDTDNTKSKENSDNLESEDSRKRSSTDRKDSSLCSSSSSSEKEKKSEEEDSSLNLGNLANLAEENCNRFLRVTSARVTEENFLNSSTFTEILQDLSNTNGGQTREL